MLRSEKPELKQLVAETVASTVAVLEELAQKTDVAKAIKSERVQQAIRYINTMKTAEREKKLNGLATKVDTIASFVEGEKAKKTARPTHLQRILTAACAMNRSPADRRREREAVWAEKAEQAQKSDPFSIFDSMFHRPR